MEDRVGVLISFDDPSQFLKIKETLTRIGIASVNSNQLYQSCHILHRKGQYFIVHFKEMFKLDGKPTKFTFEDKCRRDHIAQMLSDWKLLKIIDTNWKTIIAPNVPLTVIPYRDKAKWKLIPKYSIGKS